jgi:hypothetical protein
MLALISLFPLSPQIATLPVEMVRYVEGGRIRCWRSPCFWPTSIIVIVVERLIGVARAVSQ